ncbi:hypothetical protein [Pseudomonas sp. TE3610]
MDTIVSLEDVMSYENPALVRAYAKKMNLTQAESEDLFVDLKKWLWLIGARDGSEFDFPSFPEQVIIDSFWHEFILSTVEYTKFCQNFFHRYIHHIPTPDGVNGASLTLAAHDPARFIEINRAVLSKAMHEVYEKLGADVVRRWYVDLPRLYPVR